MLPLVVEVEDTRTEGTETACFRASPVRLGRNALNDLMLDEPYVSQWHGMIHFDEQGTSFVDVGSTNGTSVDGRRVQQQQTVALREGSLIEIGPVRLRLRRSESADGRASGQLTLGPKGPRILRHTQEPSDTGETNAWQTELSGPPTGANTEQGSSVIAQLRHLQHVLAAIRPERKRYVDALTDAMRALPPEVRRKVIPQLVRELPELEEVPEFLEAAGELGVEHGPLQRTSVRRWMEQLTGRSIHSGKVTEAQMLARVAAVLQTFAQAHVELRRAREQFVRDMGLPAAPPESDLGEPHDAQELLETLFDFSTGGEEPIFGLTRAFADLAAHPVALLQGVMEGARAMVERLSPDTIQKCAERDRQKSAFGGMMPLSAARKWRAFVRRHHDMSESDHFVRELFGARFVRAYCAVAGGVPASADRPGDVNGGSAPSAHDPSEGSISPATRVARPD